MEKRDLCFGQLIKSVRLSQNIRQRDLARGLFSVPMMSYVERGIRPIDYQTKKRLLARLGIGTEGYEVFFAAYRV